MIDAVSELSHEMHLFLIIFQILCLNLLYFELQCFVLLFLWIKLIL